MGQSIYGILKDPRFEDLTPYDSRGANVAASSDNLVLSVALNSNF